MSQKNPFQRLFQTAPKYAEVAGVLVFVGIVVIVCLALLGPAVGNVFSTVYSAMPTDLYPSSPSSQPASASQTYPGPEMVLAVHAVYAQAPQRQVIRDGQLALVVKDPRHVRGQVEAIVGELEGQGAFIVSSQESGGSEKQAPSISLIIRIPAEHFSQVMDRVAALAEQIDGRSETAQDVSEEYYDLQGRLESMEAGLQRLRDILKNAQKVEDVLKIEGMITQRQTEIEAIQGRLQYLTRSARLSKIEITLRPPTPEPQPVPIAPWQPGEDALRALADLKNSAQSAISALIYLSIAILPWLLFFILLVFAARRMLRWAERRFQPPAA